MTSATPCRLCGEPLRDHSPLYRHCPGKTPKGLKTLRTFEPAGQPEMLPPTPERGDATSITSNQRSILRSLADPEGAGRMLGRESREAVAAALAEVERLDLGERCHCGGPLTIVRDKMRCGWCGNWSGVCCEGGRTGL